MSLLPDEGIGSFYLSEMPISALGGAASIGRRAETPLVEAKLRIPAVKPRLVPPRLTELLERSIRNYSGTLIVGRAGVGKTTLATDLCSRVRDSAWYTIDAVDPDWAAFSRYFIRAVLGRRAGELPATLSPIELFAELTATMDSRARKWPSLLVLDGVHYLYDSGWFAEFFHLLIASLPPPAHVLILSRSKPPNPIWRLRSKQMLGVIDERAMSFSLGEAEELFARNGLEPTEGARAYRESYGQAGKLIRILESKVRTACSK